MKEIKQWLILRIKGYLSPGQIPHATEEKTDTQRNVQLQNERESEATLILTSVFVSLLFVMLSKKY